ncbi:hypothetical protein Ancab_028815 [Ancistrocladus abbreviatus]
MIQTLNPCPTSSKTDEIMSRYRPIAPKPEAPITSNHDNGPMSRQKMRHSPYLRNIWAHLQARPTRTRKRGRTAISPSPTASAPAALKRSQRTPFLGLCSPSPVTSPAQSLSLQGFGHGGVLAAAQSSMVTLPLPSCPIPAPAVTHQHLPPPAVELDLNRVAGGLEEEDLLLQLKVPNVCRVITPQPIRPIGSSISVGCISEDPNPPPLVAAADQMMKKAEEVEEEVEAEALPAIISDSNNRVRMANSAYKEMVGQPECPWLDSMVSGASGRRISGEVVLRLMESVSDSGSGSGSGLRISGANGFCCWVRIEWERNGEKRGVNAFCDVVRLVCVSKDYVLIWRFHTREVSPSGSGSKV